MQFSVPHSLSQEEALLRVKNLIKSAKKDHGNLVTDVKEKWKENTGTFSFTAKGYAISGTLIVFPSEIQMEGEVPWALTFMKGTIEKNLKAKAKELLN